MPKRGHREPKCKDRDCVLWEPGKEECDDCIDGRFIGAVCDYASTCDGCGELTSHDSMYMDPEAQFGYCETCQEKMGLTILVDCV